MAATAKSPAGTSGVGSGPVGEATGPAGVFIGAICGCQYHEPPTTGTGSAARTRAAGAICTPAARAAPHNSKARRAGRPPLFFTATKRSGSNFPDGSGAQQRSEVTGALARLGVDQLALHLVAIGRAVDGAEHSDRLISSLRAAGYTVTIATGSPG